MSPSGITQGIAIRQNGDRSLDREVSRSHSISHSMSPTDSFHPQHRQSWGQESTSPNFLRRTATGPQPKQLKPFREEDIKILLLENVNQAGKDILTAQGYQVESLKSSLPEDQLIEKIKDIHVLGIRSKTKLTARVLSHAKNLIAVGCFCIGTNQVDLAYAASHGICVFNSPFSNSRSVAELIICEIIALARQMPERSLEMHNGTWNKVSNKCWEVRGKTLGIIGYGHIGSQLSVLAESLGMSVIYHDAVNPIMSLGTTRQVPDLPTLLRTADFVTCHVPETPDTANLISTAQFALMKKGSYLLNASRGSVVDIPALITAMQSAHIAGAALDVYPSEPGGNGDYFDATLSPFIPQLRQLRNIILTPHIGGSTEEAQSAIGAEVSSALTRYINEGVTLGSVNLPQVALRDITIDEPNHARVIFIHQNVPGVLRRVNEILGRGKHNVDKQMSDSKGEVAYLMADISDVNLKGGAVVEGLYAELNEVKEGIVTRILY